MTREKNKKRYRLFLLLLCLMLLVSTIGLEAKTRRRAKTKPNGILAYKSSLELSFRGVSYDSYDLPSYVVENKSYYRLKDLAWLLKRSYNEFNIVWNQAKGYNVLKKQERYLNVKPEIVYDPAEKIYINWATAPFEIDNQVKVLRGFLYQGEFFVHLNEIMQMMNVGVKWIPEKRTIKLIPKIAEDVFPFDREDGYIWSHAPSYYKKWAEAKKHFLYEQDGNYHVVYSGYETKESDDKTVYIEELSKSMQTIETRKLAFYGKKLGGFFHGEKYNYLVFGNDNQHHKNDFTVLTLVKTDHDFRFISSLDIKDAFTEIPFDGGSVSMDEYQDILMIHTARKRYDGHQSQLTVAVDTKNMKTLNYLGSSQENHVSHSFNQFALFDKKTGDLFLVDHGDAHPRAITIAKMNKEAKKLVERADIVPIYGSTGANETGAYVGGMEQSEDKILVSLAHVDYSKTTYFDHHRIKGEDVNFRNAYVYIVSKKSMKNSIKKVQLTDYESTYGYGYTAPQIISIGDNRYFVMWLKERVYTDENFDMKGVESVVQYKIIDDEGRTVNDTTSLAWHHVDEGNLIYDDGYVIWQVRNPVKLKDKSEAGIYRVKVK